MFFCGQKTEWWSLYNPSGLITTFVAWTESDGLWSVLMNSEQHYFLQLFNDLLTIIHAWKNVDLVKHAYKSAHFFWKYTCL